MPSPSWHLAVLAVCPVLSTPRINSPDALPAARQSGNHADADAAHRHRRPSHSHLVRPLGRERSPRRSAESKCAGDQSSSGATQAPALLGVLVPSWFGISPRRCFPTAISPHHPVISNRPFDVLLSTPDDVWTRIRYVEGNPVKDGLAAQRWAFVTPYDNWPLHKRR